MATAAHVDEHGHVTPHVLKPREVAEILGLDESTIYRMLDRGELDDAFADDAGLHRKGVPAWQVEERINRGRARCGCACHQTPTVASPVGGVPPHPSFPAAVGGGGPHLRSVPEVAPSGAA